MDESWRIALYPLGYICATIFAIRFMLQWLISEMQQRSVVNKAFWIISLIGGFILFTHAFIQVQFHVCCVQAISIIIYCRNLNLMQDKSKQIKKEWVIACFALLLFLVTIAFILQSVICFEGRLTWFRSPITSWQPKAGVAITPLWNCVGTLGVFLFASRFWVQWWEAEKKQKSFLSTYFWYFSLAGAALSSLYFFHIKDPVNMIGPSFGFIPYIRNLMLIKKQKKLSQAL